MIERTDNTETVIDLREVVSTLLYRWWIILLSVLLVGAGAFGYTYFRIEPTYEAKTLMYVNNTSISLGSTSVSISNSELTVAQKLVATYVVILQSRTMLNRVIDEAELDYTYEELRKMVSANAVNETEIFEIVVTDHSPVEAEKIANTIAGILPDVIASIVAGSDVRIVDYAVVPARRAGPNYTRNAAVGAIIGLLISAIAIIVAHMLDENIRSEDYLTQTYPDIPLLAVIPDMKPSTKHRSGEAQNTSAAQRSASRSSSSRGAVPSGRSAGGQRSNPAANASRRPQGTKKALPAASGAERAAGQNPGGQGGQNKKRAAQAAPEAAKRGQPQKKSAAAPSRADKPAGRPDPKKPADSQKEDRPDKKGQLIWDKKVRKWKEID